MQPPVQMSESGNRNRWLALAAAILGWFCDGFEMGLFPVTARDALTELCNSNAGEQEIARWYSMITACFLVGAAGGGVIFGLLGDRIGRVRALMASILTYSVCSGCSAFATHPAQLALFRFLGALGMGGEWALGVALVMEVWPKQSRFWLAGLIGAAGNLGFALCGIVAILIRSRFEHVAGMLTIFSLPPDWLRFLTEFHGWRLLMLVGTMPAMLALLIRLFVAESSTWSRSVHDNLPLQLSGVRSLILGTLLALIYILVWWINISLTLPLVLGPIILCAVLTLFIQPGRRLALHHRRTMQHDQAIVRHMLIGVALASVPLLGTWTSVMWMYLWVGKLTSGGDSLAVPTLQVATSTAAALGCVAAISLTVRFRRLTVYRLLCVLSIAFILLFYQTASSYDRWFLLTASIMSFATAAFYGWLPLYLPELFPVVVRAYGQGLSFNFGRIIAAFGTLHVPLMLSFFQDDYPAACTLPVAIYGLGIFMSYYIQINYPELSSDESTRL